MKMFICLCFLLILLSCSKGLKEPVGPSIKSSGTSTGNYEFFEPKLITGFEPIEFPEPGLETTAPGAYPLMPPLGGKTNYFYCAKDSDLGLSYPVENGNTYMEIDYLINTTPNNSQWEYNNWLVITFNVAADFTKHGNYLMFDARSIPGEGRVLGVMQIQFWDENSGTSIGDPISLTSEWKRYMIKLDPGSLGNWGSPADFTKIIYLNMTCTYNPGTLSKIDIDNMKLTFYFEKR